MRSIFLALCVLSLAVSSASAQDQEKPRRGGGGFGGGRGGPGGMGQDTVGILRMPEVQKELGLDEAKKKEATAIVEKTEEELRGSVNFRELQGLSNEERQKKMEELGKKREEANQKALDQLAKVLDAKQLERFKQLRLQREGVTALARPEVAQKLELSQEQKDKIKKIQDEARQAAGNFGQLSDEERRDFFAKAEERRQKVNADVLAVLTPSQKENWDKMLGAKFEFPRGGFGGPGGGGRRGGPGGAPGGGGGEKGEKKRPEAKKDEA